MLKKGQSALEYIVLIVIVVAALVTAQVYIKRGIQGHMKKSVDDLGEQYDPGYVNSLVNYATTASSDSSISVGASAIINGVAGYYTKRLDTTNSVETRQGNTTIDPP